MTKQIIEVGVKMDSRDVKHVVSQLQNEVLLRALSLYKVETPCLIWLTGLSGAGKSTIASLLEKKLQACHYPAVHLDGDQLRSGLNADLGFSDEDRHENLRRAAYVSRVMLDAGLIVIASFISPFAADRARVKSIVAPHRYYEIFVDAPLSVVEARDPKGLYHKARQGLIPNFTGIDSVYEPPTQPDVYINTATATPNESAEQVLQFLLKQSLHDIS